MERAHAQILLTLPFVKHNNITPDYSQHMPTNSWF